ncbi:MAG: radical SAM protein [Promethearchaeia archaeon]
MHNKFIPIIPNHIVLRRYENINIYDIKLDESYLIDEEAYSVLKLINGRNTVDEILKKYPMDKKEEIREALATFSDLKIISFLPEKPKDSKEINTEHLNLPEKNPLKQPYLKNLMVNITERCNLKCKHCYITNKDPVDMELQKLKKIIKDFYELQGIRLILTGGEPFIYKHLKELLSYLKEFALQKVLLSNGTLITQNKELIDLLKDNNVEIFISMDGLEESHNDFRDANCFQDTIDGIKFLLSNSIKTSINTMVHKQNIDEFEEMFNLINALEGNIANWSIDIPTFEEDIPEGIRKKYEVPGEEGGKILKHYGWGEVYESECHNFACGPNLMAIDVKGIVTKCGFFYSRNAGNIFKIGMEKAWKRIQKNLNWTLDELKCEDCDFIENCRGGCRYRAFKQTGNIQGIDKYKCYQFGKIKNNNNVK